MMSNGFDICVVAVKLTPSIVFKYYTLAFSGFLPCTAKGLFADERSPPDISKVEEELMPGSPGAMVG